jgi:hypothetical protein
MTDTVKINITAKTRRKRVYQRYDSTNMEIRLHRHLGILSPPLWQTVCTDHKVKAQCPLLAPATGLVQERQS